MLISSPQVPLPPAPPAQQLPERAEALLAPRLAAAAGVARPHRGAIGSAGPAGGGTRGGGAEGGARGQGVPGLCHPHGARRCDCFWGIRIVRAALKNETYFVPKR